VLVCFIPNYALHERYASIFMQGPLRLGAELEPSLLSLIRVIGYTKLLFYAIFE